MRSQRRLASVLICMFSSAGGALAQGACPIELPAAIDLTAKRSEMIKAYPALPHPMTAASLRQQGSRHADFEVKVIGGWRSEIEGRCLKVKEVETKVGWMNSRGELSPNDFAACIEAISDERLLCDIKHKSSSPYYALLEEVEKFNAAKFQELTTAWNECSRNNICNP